MSELLDYFERSKKLVHLASIILANYFVISSIVNIALGLEIIYSEGTIEFIDILDSVWLPTTWIGRAVLSYMQYYFSNGLVFLLSLINTIQYHDLILFVLLFFYWSVLTKNTVILLKQKLFYYIVMLQAISYCVMLSFIYLALNSLSTSLAFNNLKAGALIFIIINVIRLLLASITLFLRQRKKRYTE